MPLRRVLGRVTPGPYGDTMTAHEALTALLWLVLLGYLVYLGWFVVTTVSGWGSPDDRVPDAGGHSPTDATHADFFDMSRSPSVAEAEQRRAS